MANNQTSFCITHREALQSFAQLQSGSAFGKWVVAQLGGRGFWSGADYDFWLGYRDLIAQVRAQGKRIKPDAQINFSVQPDGRGVVTLGQRN